MNKLSKRLQTIASIVRGKVIADVGCDHGKLSLYLLQNNVSEFAYISDISAPSLQKAIKLLTDNNCRFEAICCDGLVGYSGKQIDECIISGMGGEEIMEIISNSPISISTYILSPQHNVKDVKKFMLKSGYNITYDVIINDNNKFYTILRCEKSDNVIALSEFDLLFGKENFTRSESDIGEFVNYELNKINSYIEGISSPRREELIRYIELLELAKKRIENNE